mmetsp:Transcript_125211/g.196203  ORF Transcript_125211/g.196203 Transcript_125211/m.196203 type:complete len:253 (+) Transcript_125211:98-856(+)
MCEKKPHCPTCCRVLSGQLVASRCNHVFHRDCLPPVDAPCPKCHAPDAGQNALDLFGLNFGPKFKSCKDAFSVDLPTAAKVISLRQEVEEQKNRVMGLKNNILQAKQYEETQKQKLKIAEKNHSAKEEQLRRAKANFECLQAKHENLMEQMQRKREESVISEYRDIFASGGSEDEALEFITRIVEMALDPAPLLTEMARLRDYYRASAAKAQSQCVKISKNESRDRREIAEKQRVVTSCKRKLEKPEITSSS